MNSFRHSLNVRARVIRALILREVTTRYGDSKLGFFWALIEPATFLLVFVMIFSIIGRSSPLPGDLYTFFLSGLIPFLMFRSISSAIGNSESANKALLVYPQVTTIDIKVARTIIEFLVTLFVATLTFFALYEAGYVLAPVDDVFQLLLCLLLLLVFSFGFGLIIASIIAYWPNFQKLFQPLTTRPLFLLSGIFFIPEQIPAPYNEWVAYNPLTQFIAWSRSSVYSNFDSIYGFNWNLVVITLALLVMGLALEKVTLRRKMALR